MRRKPWLYVFCLSFALAGCLALAKDHGHGKGHGHDANHYAYTDHDQEIVRVWYRDHVNHLPPGLAKRDRLPPGLEKQLERRGTLPPGLQKKIQPCPIELERQLPPPPPDYAHTIIGGHIVLMNRKTYAVLDVFHIEP